MTDELENLKQKLQDALAEIDKLRIIVWFCKRKDRRLLRIVYVSWRLIGWGRVSSGAAPYIIGGMFFWCGCPDWALRFALGIQSTWGCLWLYKQTTRTSILECFLSAEAPTPIGINLKWSNYRVSITKESFQLEAWIMQGNDSDQAGIAPNKMAR